MANDCLITRLKATVNNDNLVKLGEVVVNHSNVAGKTAVLKLMTRGGVGVTNISVSEGGSFTVDGVSRSSYQLAAGTEKSFTFSSGDYKIHIDNKYNLIEFSTSNGDYEPFVSNYDLLRNLKYSAFGILELKRVVSPIRAEELPNGLTKLNLYLNTGFTGSLSDLGKLTSLNTFNISETAFDGGDVVDYVSALVDNGKTSASASSPISFENIAFTEGITFNNVSLLHAGDGGKIIFEGKTKIAVFVGGFSITASTKVFTYGYTQSEAETNWPDKTITMVDD